MLVWEKIRETVSLLGPRPNVKKWSSAGARSSNAFHDNFLKFLKLRQFNEVKIHSTTPIVNFSITCNY